MGRTGFTLRAGVSTAAMTVSLASAASAMTFTVDGVYDTFDSYTHEFLVPMRMDPDPNGVGAVDGRVLIGIGDNRNGTGGPDDLFLYFEIPLEFKDNTWGENVHSDYGGLEWSEPDDQKKLTFNGGQTGSENIAFAFDGDQDVEVKLSARDNSDTGDKLDCNVKGSTCIGHEVEEDAGGALLDQATSLDYIMQNFNPDTGFNENYELWGDMEKESSSVSVSPKIADNNAPDGVTEVPDDYVLDSLDAEYDAALEKWPFHQAWELQFDLAGTDILTKLNNNGGDLTVLTLADLFGTTGSSDEQVNIALHASPAKSGENSDTKIVCDVNQNDPNQPGYCPGPTELPPMPPIPLPASLPLLLGGLGGMALLGKRRRRKG